MTCDPRGSCTPRQSTCGRKPRQARCGRSGQARALGDRSAPKRTLTNLYNARPTWLANAHRALDDAVAAACGWPADLIDDAILGKLLALNLEPVRATVSV